MVNAADKMNINLHNSICDCFSCTSLLIISEPSLAFFDISLKNKRVYLIFFRLCRLTMF